VGSGPTRIRIRRGLDLPIEGAPTAVVEGEPEVGSVALIGVDHPGVRAKLLVERGQRVRLGEPLFVDRARTPIRFTAPGTGVVSAIHWGERRALHSVVIALEGAESVEFEAVRPEALPGLDRERVVDRLLESGLWPSIRTRPFGRIPDPGSVPRSLFVTAMESDPLAPPAEVILAEHRRDFANGIDVLSRLTDGPLFICKAPGTDVPTGTAERVRIAEFDGPHPAGLPGTHIHFLDPVGPSRTVWHVPYPEGIAIGRLFTTGRPWVNRVIALGGPLMRRPRLIRTRLGAHTEDLVRGEIEEGECRVVSGSLLSGRHAAGWGSYLGRFHTQIAAVREGTGARGPAAPSPGWLLPRWGGRSAWRIPPWGGLRARDRWTTALHGAPTAMVPLGRFERVVPLRILPTPLLRALLTGDVDEAAALGCLELDEEDLALCTFLCPSKIEYGPFLRAALLELEKT
jgi:Na+-transporting NADH:ubiquinone oxidoreductase subunit A